MSVYPPLEDLETLKNATVTSLEENIYKLSHLLSELAARDDWWADANDLMRFSF